MKHILILGAGKSTSYLISHLLRDAQERDRFVTVCDRDIAAAQARVNGHTRGQAIGVDINRVRTLEADAHRRHDPSDGGKAPSPGGARDMVILVHEIEALYPKEKNRVEKITDTMIEYGTPNGETAISGTVGLPPASTTKLILDGKIPLSGCHIPTHPAIYRPVLVELEKTGLPSPHVFNQ